MKTLTEQLTTAIEKKNVQLALNLIENLSQEHIKLTKEQKYPEDHNAQKANRVEITHKLFPSSLLFSAAEKNLPKIVEQLILVNFSGSDARNNQGQTILHIAAKNGYKTLVKTIQGFCSLSSYNFYAPDKKGYTPLDYIVERGDIGEFNKFLSHNLLYAYSNPSFLSGGIQLSHIFHTLHLAAKKGSDIIFDKLFQFALKSNSNNHPKKKQTIDEKKLADLLYWAADNGCEDLIRKLVSKDIDINAADKDQGFTALHAAVSGGYTEIVKILLAAKANPNVVTKEGITPLHNAANGSYIELIKILLAANANPNAATKEGITPLHNAADKGFAEIAELLLDAGADVSLKTENGFTVLSSAVRYANKEKSLPNKDEYYALVDLLLNRGADIDVPCNEGWNPLVKAAYDNDSIMLGKLLNKATNVESKNQALRVAVYGRKFLTVKTLLESGVDANIKMENGSPILHVAIDPYYRSLENFFLGKGSYVVFPCSKNIEVFQALLKHGANVNSVDQNGWTALHFAAAIGHIPVVRELLQHEAEINTLTPEGSTALHLAIQPGYHRITELFLEERAGTKEFQLLSGVPRSPDIEMVRELLNNGADINAKDNYGFTPLHAAVAIAWEGQEKFKELLSRDDIDVNIPDKDGWTALHWAVHLQKADMVNELLAAGANVNLQNADGWTPLHIAIDPYYLKSGKIIGSQEIIKKLLEQHPDLTLTTNKGWTALHVAATAIGMCTTIGNLIDAGADQSAVDIEGHTPWDLAHHDIWMAKAFRHSDFEGHSLTVIGEEGITI